MIIAATLVARPRTRPLCHVCHQPITGMALRLFGRIETGPACSLYLHPHCVVRPDPKILAALSPLSLDLVHPRLRRHLQDWSQTA